MTQWQPISTAPKDGTEFLGAIGFDCALINWDSRESDWMVYGDYDVTNGNPTHWMALPNTPEELAEKSENTMSEKRECSVQVGDIFRHTMTQDIGVVKSTEPRPLMDDYLWCWTLAEALKRLILSQ